MDYELKINSVLRCNSNGGYDKDGSYCSVDYNRPSVMVTGSKIYLKLDDSQTVHKIDITNATNHFVSGEMAQPYRHIVIVNLPTDNACDVMISIEYMLFDKMKTDVSNVSYLPKKSENTMLKIDKVHNSMSIGTEVSNSGCFNVGLYAKFLNGTNILALESFELRSTEWTSNVCTINLPRLNGFSYTCALVAPDPGATVNFDEYYNCGVRCINANGVSFTFKCESIPTRNLSINILVINCLD